MSKVISDLFYCYLRARNSIWIIIAPITLALVFFWTQARMGFVPTDDGSMLAQAWRIAKGEIPHVDFDSIRPAGSAILHAPFTLLPWGMLAADRLFVTLEVIWIAFASTNLILRNQKIWPELNFSIGLSVFLINVGTWPILAWHTIDGLFFAISSLWLLDKIEFRSRISFLGCGFVWLLAGSAALMKQGFFLVPLAVIALALGQKKNKALVLLPLSGVPICIYAVLTSPGGFFTQITRSTKPSETLIPFSKLLSFAFSVTGLITIFCAFLSFVIIRSFRTDYSIVINTLLITLALMVPMWKQSLDMVGDWAWALTLFLIINLVTIRKQKEFLGLGIALLLVGYSVSLSRGVPGPSLIAGTYFGLSLVMLLTESGSSQIKNCANTELSSKSIKVISRLKSLTVPLIVLIVIAVSMNARSGFIYGEGRRTDLIANVEHPQFQLIKMSARSAAYVNNAIACLSKYPSTVTAIVPDGPALYPLLGMNNPFRNDWWNNGEIDYFGTGLGENLHRKDKSQVAARLNLQTDWLILVQTKSINEVVNPQQVREKGHVEFTYFQNDTNLLSQLKGNPVQCGMLNGKYRAYDNTNNSN